MRTLCFLLLFFTGFVFSSECVFVDTDGVIISADAVGSTDCDYLLVTSDELASSNDELIAVLNDLFLFDADDFALHHGYLAVVFVTSFGAGVVCRWLGKAK